MPDPLAASNISTQQIYKTLSTRIDQIGAFVEDPKTQSIQLVRAVDFAIVYPFSAHLMFDFKSKTPVSHPRVLRVEQVAQNRWYNRVKINSEYDIDAELLKWTEEAYELGN